MLCRARTSEAREREELGRQAAGGGKSCGRVAADAAAAAASVARAAPTRCCVRCRCCCWRRPSPRRRASAHAPAHGRTCAVSRHLSAAAASLSPEGGGRSACWRRARVGSQSRSKMGLSNPKMGSRRPSSASGAACSSPSTRRPCCPSRCSWPTSSRCPCSARSSAPAAYAPRHHEGPCWHCHVSAAPQHPAPPRPTRRTLDVRRAALVAHGAGGFVMVPQ